MNMRFLFMVYVHVWEGTTLPDSSARIVWDRYAPIVVFVMLRHMGPLIGVRDWIEYYVKTDHRDA